MSQPPNVCDCGGWKSRGAKMCDACRYGEVKVTPVPVVYEINSARDAFEWIISQSRGEIS